MMRPYLPLLRIRDSSRLNELPVAQARVLQEEKADKQHDCELVFRPLKLWTLSLWEGGFGFMLKRTCAGAHSHL